MLETPGLEGLKLVDHVTSGDQHFGWLRTVIGTEKHAEPYFAALSVLLEETRGRLSLLGDVWDLTYCTNEAIKTEFDLFRPVFERVAKQGKIKVMLSDHEPDMDHDRLAAAIGEEAAGWFDIKSQYLYEDEANPGTVMTHGHLLAQAEVLETLERMKAGDFRGIADIEALLTESPDRQVMLAAIKQTRPALKRNSIKICERDAQLCVALGIKNHHPLRRVVEQLARPAIYFKEQRILQQSCAEVKRLLPEVQVVLTAHTHSACNNEAMLNAGSISGHVGQPGVIVQGVQATGARVTRLLLLNKAGDFERKGEDRVMA